MNSIMNTAVGAMAVATFLVVCLMKKKKLKLSTVYTTLKGPYFYPTKQLTVKDEVFLSMLENCQSVGPCYVITDPSLRDNPIVYASEGFCKFTGYTKEEIEGRNCRFLQGKNSSPEDVSRIRTAIEKKEEVSVCLLNYRKDGSTFLNQFFLTPLYDEEGNVAYHIGVQAEVKAKAHFPGKEKLNAGFKMFRCFESNVTDSDVRAHSKTETVLTN